VNPEEFANFEIRGGTIPSRSEGIETVVVPDIKTNGQSIQEILIQRGHSILTHLSDEKIGMVELDRLSLIMTRFCSKTGPESNLGLKT
jgi:hypothetical protein